MIKNHSFTILLVLLISMISTKIWAYDIAVQNADGVKIYYYYINNGNELEVAQGYYSGSVVIPEKVTYMNITRKVTSIGYGAFEQCYDLTSVTIPNSVTNIAEHAFYACYGLTSVTIPNSVTSIGKCAFSRCRDLVSISVASGNKKYDSRNNCNAIIESASNTLIFGCKNTNIPNSVTSIGDDAFYGCWRMTSITIPNSVTNIGEYAFSDCSSLTSITIPSSVTNIDKMAFSSCRSLASISIASGNIIYDSRDNCNAIIETATNTLIYGCKNSFIPNGVRIIGSNAFENCYDLTSITLPNSVTSIGSVAFHGCAGLTSVTIPNSVTSIGGWAFDGCRGLKSITIPNSVTSIGSHAFYNCSGLTSVTIGSGVTSIGYLAFHECSNLKSVIVKMIIPVAIDYGTFSISWGATLYVPYGCRRDYATTQHWREFSEIVEAVEVDEISQINNSIYAEPMIARVGDDVSIKVFMKNANAATSYGFELVLPSGFSIATTTEGDFYDAVTMSIRHKGHTLTTNKLANNTYKVGVTSLSSETLTDNDGLVLTIKAHVADDISVGDYPILIQNPLIVNTDGTKRAVQNTLSKITIEDYTKGDVDGDGVVDLADAVLVINHYVGKPVNKFVTKAADVDGDGVIDLADAVRIINFYVGKVQSLAPSIVLDGLDPQ